MNRALTAGRPASKRPTATARARPGFTLLEVMIAIGVLGIALIALLALQHEDLRSVIRGEQISTAALLAQTLMTRAEMQRFPPVGHSSGNFNDIYPGSYRNYRWTRNVSPSSVFPDLRKVVIRVLYGPRFERTYEIVEFMHNPIPLLRGNRSQARNPALQNQGLANPSSGAAGNAGLP